MRPSRAWSFRPLRGRGERRMPVAPAASCALCIGKKHTSKRVHRNHPTFPHAMVLTASFVLSPVTGLFCHRRQRIWFCLNPVGPTQLRKLDASVGASGPHDFAVRSNISRQRAVDRSRIRQNPPCDPIARKTLPRPSHPVPYVRDDRETPLCVGRDAKSSRCDLGGTKTEIFLQKGLDTPVNKPPDGQITTRLRRAI